MPSHTYFDTLKDSILTIFFKDGIINLASMNKSPETVDAYIATFPESTQLILRKIRCIIKNSASESIENIAYGMPAYKIKGKPLVYFAGYKNHIGFYATPTGHEAFAEELSQYKQGKGSVQFSLAAPMPYDLIERIVEFRVKENQVKISSQKD